MKTTRNKCNLPLLQLQQNATIHLANSLIINHRFVATTENCTNTIKNYQHIDKINNQPTLLKSYI